VNFNRELFSDKLKRYCEQLLVSTAELSKYTGIPAARIENLIEQVSDPTGDEVLILADYFKCDFKFFISNEKLAPFEQTELMFRRYGSELNKTDRWAIQEFLYLCECEAFLLSELSHEVKKFYFTKFGNIYKEHGKNAALELRKFLGYSENQVAKDVYKDIRKIGMHVFRRKLLNSTISGFYVKHPTAGPSMLINYHEDVYRQRFSAAHELAHAILDNEEDFVISHSKFKKDDLVEIRANAFASNYLLPGKLLETLPKSIQFTPEVISNLSSQLMVNVTTLLIALKQNGYIDGAEFDSLRDKRIKLAVKSEPEVCSELSRNTKKRSEIILDKGLSLFYVELCLDAFGRDIISFGRMSEMLLMARGEAKELMSLFSKSC
jgi:Zn-dependent peptidase ImmA (M78 family)/transcriptional regulator with XRE-family HTH domain